jgi:hypothetical protein
MRAARRSVAALIVPATLIVAARDASAQGWMRDRRFQEGPGLRTGDFEFHPGIGGEIGYDSNWFLRSHKDGPNIVNAAPQAPVTDGAILRITPSVTLSTLGSQRSETATGAPDPTPRVLRLSGTVSATYREFFGSEDLRKQRNVSANAGVRADINSGRPIGFALFAGYQRLIQPAVVSDPNLSFNRSDLSGGAEVSVIPGGGTLDLRAGYILRAALFEESNGVPYTSVTHTISERNRWRFRPRTALFHDTSLQWVNYPYADRAVLYLNDATPLRTRAGLTGLITERVGTTLAVGYGATFFKNPAATSSTQFDSVVGQAEVIFYLSKSSGAGEPGQDTLLLSTLTFGYIRDFATSLLGNFYTINRGYAGIEYWFGGKAVANLTGLVEGQDYPVIFTRNGATQTPATGEFTNIRVGGALFGEYRLSNSFGINTTIDYQQTFSDTQIPAGAFDPDGPGPAQPGAPQFYDLNWRRLQAFVGARWFL